MLEVKWTPRFKQKLERYNGVQDYVAAKTAGLVRKYNADPVNWSYSLEKLKDKSFKSTQVYRLPITSGDRLVFVIDNKNLILADIGNHDVMDDYSRIPKSSRDLDLSRAGKPDVWFVREMHGHLSQPKDGDTKPAVDLAKVLNETQIGLSERWLYEEELDEGWIQYLDQNQISVVEEILQELEIDDDFLKVHFIYGGPGTGKTVVLLNLALQLSNQGRSVSFMLNDQVAKYLNRGKQKVPGVNLGYGPGVTVLLDDPATIDEFASAIRHAQSSKCRALVVGFDPLQWHERKMESKLKAICEKVDYSFSQLWICYRQSFGVAKKSIELTQAIFERSSRFLDHSKVAAEKQELQEHIDLISGMEFVDNSGRYMVYESALVENLNQERRRFKSRIDLWKHSPSACFIYEDALIDKWRSIVKAEFSGAYKQDLLLSKYPSIRGVEFQEVFLYLTVEFWKKINQGQYGLNASNWEKLTSLHTIFSRAKDSLVIFIDDDEF
jgi:Txe/YoeB family toxin of Txe-Axe toxin-antitoxin module